LIEREGLVHGRASSETLTACLGSGLVEAATFLAFDVE